MQVDTSVHQMSSEEAKHLLESLFRYYYDQSPNELDEQKLVPVLVNKGFPGIAYVINEIVHSDKMNKLVMSELDTIWAEHFAQKPLEHERSKYESLLRFYRAEGQKEIVSKINYSKELLSKAIKLLEKEQPKEAQSLLEQAVEHGIPSWTTWHHYGLSFFRQDRFRDAMPAYQTAIESNTNDDEYPWSCDDLKWCYVNLQEKDNEHDWLTDGLTYFQKVVELFPNRWIAQHECGLFCLNKGEFERAIDYYHKAIELCSDDTWGWSATDLLQCYSGANLKDAACEYFIDLMENRSNNWGAWECRAWCEWKFKNDAESAAISYSKAIDLHPEVGWFWTFINNGWCLGDLKRYHDAFSSFEIASKLDSQNWQAWRGMGWAKEQLGGWSVAIDYFRKDVQLNKNSIWSWVGLGRCFRKKSKPEYINSWEAYQRAILLEVDNHDAKKSAQSGQEKIGNNPWVELRKVFKNKIEAHELKTICFDLGVPFADLPGETFSEKVISLIAYFQRYQRMLELLQWLRQERPDVLPLLI